MISFREHAVYSLCHQVPYPLINHLSRPPQTLQGLCPLAFRTRTFEAFTLYFVKDIESLEVFDNVKELTVVGKLCFLPKPSISTEVELNSQPLLHIYTRSSILQRCPSHPMVVMDGRSTTFSENTCVKGSACARKPGDSRISTKTIP